MSDENPPNASPEAMARLGNQLAEHIGISAIDASLRGQIGFLLGLPGFNASAVINILLEHVAEVLCLIEPEQLRNSMLADIRRNLPAVLNRHVERRRTTAGGIFIPEQGSPGGMKPN